MSLGSWLVHPPKLTWNPKIHVFKMNTFFKGVIFFFASIWFHESYLVGVNILYPDWHLVILAGSRRSPGCSLWTATQWFMALLGVVTQRCGVCGNWDVMHFPYFKWLVYGPGMENNILWTSLEWIVESCWHFLYVTYVFLVSLLFSSLHFHAVKIHFISTRSSVHRQSPLFVELCIASSFYARAH